MTPGELRLVWFPFSHTEPNPYKKRPVLVLGAVGGGVNRAVLVAMVTGNERRVRRPRPGDVLISEWEQAGLHDPSVVRTRRLWTAEERDFEGTVLGSVEVSTLDAVRVEVRKLLA